MRTFIGSILLCVGFASPAWAQAGEQPSEAYQSLLIDAGIWTGITVLERADRSESGTEFPTHSLDETVRNTIHGKKRLRSPDKNERRWRSYSDAAIATLVTAAVASPWFADPAANHSSLLDRFVLVSRAYAKTNALTTGIKHLMHRSRPKANTFSDLPQGGDASMSFPSGHAANAFTSARLLTAFFPDMPLPLRIFTYTAAASVAYARVAADRHFFTDVTVGGLLGFWSADSTVDSHPTFFGYEHGVGLDFSLVQSRLQAVLTIPLP